MPGTEKRTLEIVARVKDQATRAFKRIGRVLSLVFVKPLKMIARVARAMTSLRNVVLGFFAVVAARRAFTFLSDIAESLDFLVKTSDRLQITTKSLQELTFVAELAGVEFKAFASGLAVLSKNIDNARQGAKLQARAFEQLGLSIEQLPIGPGGKVDMIELLAQFADGFNAIEDPATRVAALMNTLGRQGSQLGPLLSQGSAAIRQQAADYQRFVGVIDDEALLRAAQFQDALTRFRATIRGISQLVFIQLAPKISAFFDGLAVAIAENRGKILQAFKDIGTGILQVVDVSVSAIIGLVRVIDQIPGVDLGVGAERTKLLDDIKKIEQAQRITNTQIGAGAIRAARERLAELDALGSDSLADVLETKFREIKAALRAAGEITGTPADPGAAAAAAARRRQATAQAKQEVAQQELAEQSSRIALIRSFLQIEEKSRGVSQILNTLQKQTRQIQLAKAFADGTVSAEEYGAALAKVEEVHARIARQIEGGLPAFVDRMSSSLDQVAMKWTDLGRVGQQVGQALDRTLSNTVGALTDIVTGTNTAKDAFRSLATAVVADLAKIAVEFIVVSIVRRVAGLAQGGILKGVQGSVPVKGYARGGIADRPQLAVYGEGSQNEAYVPLPDGRTIPVTMTGGGGTRVDLTINALDARSVRQLFVEERETLWGIMQHGIRGGSRQLHNVVRGKA